MPYTFTTQQLDKIRTLSNQAEGQFSANRSAPGAYAQVYQYVADVLAGKVDQAPGAAAPYSQGADVQQVQLWFAGAARANAGEEPFSTLIREYTQAQAELRGLDRFTPEKMQEASNAVGQSALGDLLNQTGENAGRLLSITDIATNDATAVGKVLFPSIPNADKNPAWSGTVLFGMLGSDQTWRVYGNNGTYSDTTQCMDTGYAAQAFKIALDRTALPSLLSFNVGLKDLKIMEGMVKLQNGIPADLYINPGNELLWMATAAAQQGFGAYQTVSTLAERYGICSAMSLPGVNLAGIPEVINAIADVPTPPGLGTPARDSNALVTINADHTITLKGGYLSDAFVVQKNLPNGFTDSKEFYAAVLVSNPSLTNINQVSVGQVIQIPQKMPDGSITYHYAGGTSLNTNPDASEFHLTTADGSGLVTQIDRAYAADGANGPGYYTQNSEYFHGQLTQQTVAFQRALDSDVTAMTSKTLEYDDAGQPLYAFKDLLNPTQQPDVTVQNPTDTAVPDNPLDTLNQAQTTTGQLKTDAGITTLPGGPQTIQYDDGSKLTLTTDPLTGRTTAIATPAPDANLLDRGLSDISAGTSNTFTSATGSSVTLQPNGSAVTTYTYSDRTLVATTDTQGQTTYTGTMPGETTVRPVWTDASGRILTDSAGNPVYGAVSTDTPTRQTMFQAMYDSRVAAAAAEDAKQMKAEAEANMAEALALAAQDADADAAAAAEVTLAQLVAIVAAADAAEQAAQAEADAADSEAQTATDAADSESNGDGGDGTGDDGSGDDGTGEGDGTGDDGSGDGSDSSGGGDSGSSSGGTPVLIDMNGNGVELIARGASNVYFDTNGDGLLHHMGWIGKTDAMVVEDLNGDGNITTGVEFAFASRTAAQDSDLQALITLHDTNGDGQISALDAGFNKLQLWIDANSNGVSEAGELQTFAQAGLTSISGARRIVNYTAGDATVSAMGTAAFTVNGQATTRAVADVAFAVDAQGYKVLGHNSDGTTTVQTQDGKVLLQANAQGNNLVAPTPELIATQPIQTGARGFFTLNTE